MSSNPGSTTPSVANSRTPLGWVSPTATIRSPSTVTHPRKARSPRTTSPPIANGSGGASFGVGATCSTAGPN